MITSGSFVEILKDASAASIYGSRGANGVVIITTKRGGNTGVPVIKFSSYSGSQTVYFDGVSIGTGSITSTWGSSTAVLRIGSSGNNPGQGEEWNGYICLLYTSDAADE